MAIAERSEASPLVGTPQEVRRQLDRFKAQGVVAFAFDRIEPGELNTLATALAGMLPILTTLTVLRDRDGTEPVKPPTLHWKNLERREMMRRRARKELLDSGDWLSAKEVARIAGLSERNPSVQPNKWKRSGRIFAIDHDGQDYFPAYGLDPEAAFRPCKALAEIIAIFKDHKDGWGLGYWFHSANSFLGGRRPQDLLATEPDQVIAAAKDEVAGVTHG